MKLSWVDCTTDLSALVPLVQAVAATGGAVGWLQVPPPQEVTAWASGLIDQGTSLLLATEGAGAVGCGAWTRMAGPVLWNVASVSKVMTHPDARGRGVADAVVARLVASARSAGVELLTLDARGNNHGALRLYARTVSWSPGGVRTPLRSGPSASTRCSCTWTCEPVTSRSCATAAATSARDAPDRPRPS